MKVCVLLRKILLKKAKMRFLHRKLRIPRGHFLAKFQLRFFEQTSVNVEFLVHHKVLISQSLKDGYRNIKETYFLSLPN